MRCAALFFALTCFLAVSHALGGETEQKIRIAVIPKGTTHVFWKSVEAGARKAGEDLGLEIIWKGPLQENDRAQQIQLIQQFIAEGVDGIVLAPLDHKALVQSAKDAAARNIPLVIFDSALDGEAGKDFVSFVATDNEKAGRMAGEHLVKLVRPRPAHEKDKPRRIQPARPAPGAVLLRYLVGSASTHAREEGALAALKEAKFDMLSDNRYAGATSGEARNAAINIFEDLHLASAIFCPNESSTHGMLLALKQMDRAGKVRFVGFDASPPLIEALRKGEIDALVVQNPRRMGYLAVETMSKHLKGEKVEPRIDTGAALVTKDNIDSEEIKNLLQ